MTRTEQLARLRRDLARAQAASTRAMDARAALPPGSSRARVTTANARWARAAEHRDRIQEQIDRLVEEIAAEEQEGQPCA